MTTINYGNRSHLSINDNSYGDTIVLGNGSGDSISSVSAYNTITLGNGSHDAVYTVSDGDTITLGNGAYDFARIDNSDHDTIVLGNGLGDAVINESGYFSHITLGDGNHDVVNAQHSIADVVTVGNGNDTIFAGLNTTMTVGTGHDSFVFEQTTPGDIGWATISGFDPHKDSITFASELTSSVSYHDDAHGNAVIAVDGNASDTITLEGVHAAQLHAADFHFVDDPAQAIAQHLQQIADHHAHIL
jgi:hypothetical protein